MSFRSASKDFGRSYTFTNLELNGGYDCSPQFPCKSVDLLVHGGARIRKSLCIDGNISVDGIINGQVCGNIFTSRITEKEPMEGIDIFGNIREYGDIVPGITDTYNLGALDKKWANIFTQDLVVCGTLYANVMTPIFDGNVITANIVCVTKYLATDKIEAKTMANICITSNIDMKCGVIANLQALHVDQMFGKHSPINFEDNANFRDGHQITFVEGINIGSYNTTITQGNTISIGKHAESYEDQTIAFGNYAIASKYRSIAIGHGSISSNVKSIAIGANITAYGHYDVAINAKAFSTEYGGYAGHRGGAVAIGCIYTEGTIHYAEATYYGATALGARAKATNKYSVAISGKSQAYAEYAIAIGHQAKATNYAAIAIGYDSRSFGTDSVAFGSQAFSYFASGTALGTGTEVLAVSAIAVGDNAQVDYGANQSIAIGKVARAGTNAYNAIAIGSYAHAYNKKTIAIGTYSEAANGSYAIAIGCGYTLGNGPRALSYGAIAMGYNSYVKDYSNDSIAIGRDSRAVGNDNIVIGRGAETFPSSTYTYDNIVIGRRAQAYANNVYSNYYSIAIGRRTNVGGAYSVSIGPFTEVSGFSSIGIGFGASTDTTYNAIAIGYITQCDGYNAVSIGSQTHLYAESIQGIAIGYDIIQYGARSIAIGSHTRSYITSVDSIVIGTSAIVTQTDGIAFGRNATSLGGIAIGPGVFAGASGLYTVALNTGSGSTVYQNGYNQIVKAVSSVKYKENIQPLESTLDKVVAMNPVRFKYKAEYSKDTSDNVGFIAEEMDKLFPEVVVRNKEGDVQSIQYPKLTAILTKALQEAVEKINALEVKVALLEKQ